MSARTRAASAVVVMAVALGGCGTEGLSFELDRRVELQDPGDHSEVRLPVTIRWTAEDFVTADGAGSFGVLLDRTPPPPGKGLDWLFRDDDLCAAAGCDDLTYRAQRGVYETESTSLELAEITTRGDRGDGDEHEVTVILLDGDGERVGEGAWSRQFEVVGVGS